MFNSEIILWKNLIQEQHMYSIQFVSSSLRETNKILELLKDWKQVGEGYNKDGKEIFIFSKIFPNSSEWEIWYKEAPKKLASINPTENKLEINKQTSGRRCSLCGKYGHYKKTCGRV